MEKFTRLTGIAVPMLQANIDTGALAPSTLARDHPDDLGRILFGNQRYLPSGEDDPEYVLNTPRYRDSRILVAGPNFGCGSSRETAVWALMGFGIRCVIAPSFGDIFRDNAFQNGLLPIILPEKDVRAIVTSLNDANDPSLNVDLEQGTIEMASRPPIHFDIAPERRIALLQGLDETEFLYSCNADILAFQSGDRASRPWIYVRPSRETPS